MSASPESPEPLQVPFDDRGFAYGDGLFETMTVTGARVLGLDAHLGRLFRGCQVLGFEPPPTAVLMESLEGAAAGEGPGILKLVLTRGSGGRGYEPPAVAQPRLWVRRYSWPADLQAQRVHGIPVTLLESRMGENPALAGIKHLNRLDQVLAAAEVARRAPAREGILRDQAGTVVCGVTSNLFLSLHGALVTPSIVGCGVAGIIRETLLSLSRRQRFEPVTVRSVSASELDEADEVFMTNSVRGVLPVSRLDGRELGPPGPLARSAWQALEAAGLVA